VTSDQSPRGTGPAPDPAGSTVEAGHAGHAGHQHGVPSVSDCSEALLRVFEFLDGEMGPDDHAKIRAHLDTCGECLRQYDLDQMVKVVVKRSCAPEPAPVHLRATIMRRLTVIRVDPGR